MVAAGAMDSVMRKPVDVHARSEEERLGGTLRDSPSIFQSGVAIEGPGPSPGARRGVDAGATRRPVAVRWRRRSALNRFSPMGHGITAFQARCERDGPLSNGPSDSDVSILMLIGFSDGEPGYARFLRGRDSLHTPTFL